MMPTNQQLIIGLVDYGMGNIQSVKNALGKLGNNVKIVQTPSDLNDCNSLILPGVGAFGKAMDNLANAKMIDPLREKVITKKTPILGICLGMQLMVDASEERGQFAGLGFIPGVVKKIAVPKDFRLPHIGWNNVDIKITDPLFSKSENGNDFYFVHTYQVETKPEHCTATTNYGVTVTAAIQKDHIFGVQFHPEKSQSKGLRLLQSFVDYSKMKM
jgi:imidazole glycerol-phosphate synthase subunit HisH